MLGGKSFPSRVYQAVGNFVAVDGEDELLISEDANAILAFPGFRLATAEEQNSFAAQASGKTGKLAESKGKAGKSGDENSNGG